MDRAHPGEASPQNGSAPVVAGPVELRVPAEADQLFLVRLIADGVAARADFDLDELADLRMAVDETAARLIHRALRGTVLDCRFSTRDRELAARLAATTATGEEPANTFEWHVLRTLTDTISSSAEPNPDGTFTSVITFTKTSQAAPE